ncbi:MAG: hypothetical protein KKE16_01550 [Firmicutes bacterium]|nr:hypothetical protein [Bacillota bacterium]
MAKLKFGYGWLLKWILAAILIAAGILMRIYDETVVYAVTGIAIIIFSALRVVPLLKTLKKEVLRTINLFEIVFDIIVGGFMLFVVFSGKVAPNSTSNLWTDLYGYLLAFFFFVRGLIYFVSLYYFGEKSEPIKFWFHFICVLLAPSILVLTIMGVDIIHFLGWLVLFISVGGGLYLGYDGYGGYRKYRESSKALNEGKKDTATPKVEKELPKQQPEEEKQEETYVN